MNTGVARGVTEVHIPAFGEPAQIQSQCSVIKYRGGRPRVTANVHENIICVVQKGKILRL